MAILNFLRWQPPPYPVVFDGLPTPHVFQQNDREGCGIDGLGHFHFGFGGDSEKFSRAPLW